MAQTEDRSSHLEGLRRERWAILGVVVLLLAAVAAPLVIHRMLAGGAPALPFDGPAMKPSSAGEFLGITLQLHSADPKMPFEQYVEEIARTGANTLCLSVAVYQENAGSSSVFIEHRKVPSAERMTGLIKLARRRGLRVVVMPIVLLENPRHGEWRGEIDPTKPDAWWEDYENIALYYARIAQRGGAQVLIIGSELVRLEDQTPRWRRLIRKVRGVFKGRLTYSANWDHYKDIRWWRDLDMIGMTSYHDLVGDKTPSLAVMLPRLRQIKKDILAWQKTVGLPILFTEVGWPSQEGCAKEPWNYVRSAKPDPATQDLCFQAFFKTWGVETHVAGLLVWEWRNMPSQVGGLKDVSYVPTGKPAMKTIRKFFQSPGIWSKRPTSTSAPSTTSAPATAPSDRAD